MLFQNKKVTIEQEPSDVKGPWGQEVPQAGGS